MLIQVPRAVGPVADDDPEVGQFPCQRCAFRVVVQHVPSQVRRAVAIGYVERDMCQDCYDDADEAEVADAVLCENGEPVKSGKAKTKAKAKAKAKPKAQAKAKPNAKAKAKGIAPSKSVKKVKAIAN